MRLDALPEHLVIVGSGYIGAEFAHVFSALGSRVSIIGRSGRLLRDAGRDDLRAVHRAGPASAGTCTSGTRWPASQRTRRRRRASSWPTDRRCRGDVLLVATGRVPNGDRLDLAGDRRADARRRPDRGRRPAAHRRRRDLRDGRRELGAPAQARRQPRGPGRGAQPAAPGLAATQRPPVRPRRRCSPIRRSPRSAAPRRSAARTGLDVAVPVQDYGDVAYGWAMEDTTGFCKVIAERGSGPAARRAPHRAPGVDGDPAVDPGDVVRPGGPRRWPAASTGSTPRCRKSSRTRYSGWTYRTLDTNGDVAAGVDW